MSVTLVLDPSRPCQIGDNLLALWLPRGRGRDALADGLIARVDVCENPSCHCTLANLQAVRIDDRAEKAVLGGDKLRLAWHPPTNPPHPEGSARLSVDIVTGVVEASGGGKPPETVAKFFEEPLPFWVLDAFWARWRKSRLHLAVDWKAQALEQWEPGTLLSTMLVFPDERHDCYFVDGKTYQVDTMFCAVPTCNCTEARLSMLAVSEDGESLTEVGSAQLPPETMIPVDFDGGRENQEIFDRLYYEWCRRHVPAEARLLELRDMTRQRGLELLRLASAHSRTLVPAQQATPLSRPGRNTPCPCGSGKKFKRCCGT